MKNCYLLSLGITAALLASVGASAADMANPAVPAASRPMTNQQQRQLFATCKAKVDETGLTGEERHRALQNCLKGS